MGSNLISVIRRFAAPNSPVEISFTEGGSTQRVSGTLIEACDDGVVLQADGVVRFIRSDIVQSFNIPVPPVQTSGTDQGRILGEPPSVPTAPQTLPLSTLEQSPEKVAPRVGAAKPSLPQSAPAHREKPTETTSPESALDATSNPTPAAKKLSPESIDATFVLFAGPIVSPPFEPDFSVVGLKREDQLELVRWKNRYEYALKIHEPARIRDDVAAIVRFAESLKRPEVYTLAGLIARKIADRTRSKELLLNAAKLRSDVAAKALAYQAAEDGDWEGACKYFFQHTELRPSLSPQDHDTLIAFGRALSHLPSREMPGLASIIDKCSDSDTKNLAQILLAFTLAPGSDQAASFVLLGNIAQAKLVSPTSPVFENPPDLPPVTAESTSPTAGSPKTRTGKVSANYKWGGYGFLTDDVTSETFYFRIPDVKEPLLRSSLEANQAGQRVEFAPQPPTSRRYGRYDVALLLRQLDQHEPVKADRVPRDARVAALPKSAPTYARAKRAEQFGDLPKAEQYFRKEIEQQGPSWQSAVKDLSMLLNRLGRASEAIALLEQYRDKFDNTRPVDNLRANFYLKLSKFDIAAGIFRQLQSGADSRSILTLIRQEAFCAFAQSDFGAALALLDKLRRQNPMDMQTLSLIERVKQARDAKSKGEALVDQGDALDIEAFSSGLSPFAKSLLDACEFRGVDERSRARGFYDKKDFSDVENLLNRVRGRRPRERADYSLTLAALSLVAPDAAGDLRTHDLLRRYFTFMGEAAIYDGLHRDVARCYLAEAICYATEDTVETPLSFLVATYLRNVPSATELSSEIRIHNILPQFEADKKGWEKFEGDFCYYSYLSVVATKRLDGDLKKNKALPNILHPPAELERSRNKEAARLRKEYAQLRALQSSVFGAGTLQDFVTTLITLADCTRFELDRQRLKTLNSLCSEAAAYWQEQDFLEKESKNARLASGLATFLKEVQDSPTKLSSEVLHPFARRLADETKALFQEFQRSAKPELSLKNVLGEDYCILGDDGVLPISLQLMSKAGSAPVEGIEVAVVEEGGLQIKVPAHSPEVLRGGQVREVRFLVLPSSGQVSDRAFTLRATVRYRSRTGDIGESPEQKIPIRLGTAEAFSPIVNLYQAYSGGTIVDDPEMFFGRKQLLDRIAEQVVSGPVGQCFVLYGQKRSGKSSVLRQVERRINLPCLTIPITLGEMDVKDAESSFVRLCIDKLHDRMAIDLGIEPSQWVQPSKIVDRPLDAFKEAIRRTQSTLTTGGLSSPRIVLLVDEFTYLYEYIKEGIIPATFMRHWKALLQVQCFSAVVVGQDSMPKFKQAFANEFGVTHDERITYLSRAEADALCERPILFEGKSRYRGKALDRLFELTAGSPFYLQIICDRLVRHLNRQKAVFVTEADIDIVARELAFGEEALPVERFDPLITAAGESVAEASRETYLRLLNSVAHASRQSGFARVGDLTSVENAGRLLQDLSDREVVSLDSVGRVRIRVQLFTEWLRANCPVDAEWRNA